jgi:NADH:ubiquinone oxidoreductase subunit D
MHVFSSLFNSSKTISQLLVGSGRCDMNTKISTLNHEASSQLSLYEAFVQACRHEMIMRRASWPENYGVIVLERPGGKMYFSLLKDGEISPYYPTVPEMIATDWMVISKI